MEDEDRSLLDGEPPEGPLELVAIVDGQDVAGLARPVGVQDPDRGRPLTATPGRGVALMGQDPVEPRLETLQDPEGSVARARR